MKKVFLSLLLAVLVFTVTACDKATTEAPTTLSPTTETPTTEVPTTQAPTTLEPIDNTFINTNSSIETKEQFLDKLDMYSVKMDELIWYASIPEYVDFNQQSPYIRALAVEEPDIYNREDLPVPEEPLFDEDQLNSEFIFITYQLLLTANEVLEACTSFTENEFCDVQIEGMNLEPMNFKIKMLLENNQLYIEYYVYYSMQFFGITIKQVSGQILYFNLIDNVLYFESIQDDLIYYDEDFSHVLRYNQFSENGDMLNIMIDDVYREHVYYQSYFRAEDSVFLLSNSGEGFAINYKNIANDTFYSLGLNPDLSIFNTSVIYGTNNPTFKYLSFDDATMLVWNVFDVAGWNKVYDYGYGEDMLYLDENQVLEGFYFDFEMQEEDINHQLSFQIFESEELTEGLISLSDYGMAFSLVTYDQLMADIEFIQENYQTVITNNGLSNTMEDNFDILAAMFPTNLDQELMEELYAIIEQQLEENS